MADPAPAATGGSAWAPLRHPAYAVLWVATLVGNIGLWMRDVASGWLMSSLSPSPLLVALVQAGTSLPMFLLAIPGGALADIVDRRRLLIVTQALLGCASLGLAVLAALDAVTPASLLLLTFVGGVGAALSGSAWQSITPELVPRSELKPAVALASLGFNLARAVGPAAAGVVIATAGVAFAYALDVLTYVVVICALLWWKRRPPASALPAEHLLGAIRSGLRFARYSASLRRVLLRAGAFFLFAAAYWALLPLVARQSLHGGPGLFGGLVASIGAGAVFGALLLSRLRSRGTADAWVAAGTVATAGSMLVLALVPDAIAAGAALFVAGAAWIAVLTTLNVTTQSILPDWVRGRGLAIYLTAFQGAMTLGSFLWGQVAEFFGVSTALLAAAVASLLVAAAASRRRLPDTAATLTPSMHWPEPVLHENVGEDRGPVLVAIVYRVPARHAASFVDAMQTLEAERRKDGAFVWGLYQDAAEPGRWTEVFYVESWLDHLRQHERVTEHTHALQAQVAALLDPGAVPEVSHHIAARPV